MRELIDASHRLTELFTSCSYAKASRKRRQRSFVVIRKNDKDFVYVEYRYHSTYISESENPIDRETQKTKSKPRLRCFFSQLHMSRRR